MMRQMALKNTEKSTAELPTVLRKALHKGPPTCSSCHVAASISWVENGVENVRKQHFLGHFCRTSDLELQDWGCRLQDCYSMGLPLKMYKSRFTNHVRGRVVKSWYPSEALPIHRSTKLVLSTIVCRNLYS